MRLAYCIGCIALVLAVAGCGDDDFGADGPSVSQDLSANYDIGTARDLASVDLAHD